MALRVLALTATVLSVGCARPSPSLPQSLTARPDSAHILTLVGTYHLTLSERLPDRPLPDDTATVTLELLPAFEQTHVRSLADSSRYVLTERRLLWGYVATHFPRQGLGPTPARVPQAALIVYPDGRIDMGVRAMAGGVRLQIESTTDSVFRGHWQPLQGFRDVVCADSQCRPQLFTRTFVARRRSAGA